MKHLLILLVLFSLPLALHANDPFSKMHMNDGMHKGKRILSESSIAEMRRLQAPDRASKAYGLGWFRDDVNDSG